MEHSLFFDWRREDRTAAPQDACADSRNPSEDRSATRNTATSGDYQRQACGAPLDFSTRRLLPRSSALLERSASLPCDLTVVYGCLTSYSGEEIEAAILAGR